MEGPVGDVVPIYEDTAAMLYCFLPDGEEENQDDEESRRIKQHLISSVGELLQDARADVRTGFMSAERLESREVDPLDHVERGKLRPLIRYSVLDPISA